MRVAFWKMHGAGNDFILIDDTALTFPMGDTQWIANFAARRTGVGCDGVILIQPSADCDFRMRFINPDGGEVDMCGNGLRCICRLAHERGIADAVMSVQTEAGEMKAECLAGGQVCAWFPPIAGTGVDGAVNVAQRRVPYRLIDTGVPHAVVRVDQLHGVSDPVADLGRAIRYHSQFAPDGTNVDFIHADATAGTVSVRTYERGVEGETLACGTGVVASAVVATLHGMAQSPVCVSTAGGDTMTVSFELAETGVTAIALTGPAEHVYEGSLEYRP